MHGHACEEYMFRSYSTSSSSSPDQFLSVQSCIQTCIDDVLLWMNSNKLKLNTDKTEVMPVGSASCLESVDSECANIGGNSVPFKTSVKYLGVHLDKTLSVQKHISSICCASFLELRRIASIRPYLSQSAAARLVAAMVIYPALIIATQFSQVYQQTRSLSHSGCRITRHGS